MFPLQFEERKPFYRYGSHTLETAFDYCACTVCPELVDRHLYTESDPE